jgi:hypothetical protein
MIPRIQEVNVRVQGLTPPPVYKLIVRHLLNKIFHKGTNMSAIHRQHENKHAKLRYPVTIGETSMIT